MLVLGVINNIKAFREHRFRLQGVLLLQAALVSSLGLFLAKRNIAAVNLASLF